MYVCVNMNSELKVYLLRSYQSQNGERYLTDNYRYKRIGIGPITKSMPKAILRPGPKA